MPKKQFGFVREVNNENFLFTKLMERYREEGKVFRGRGGGERRRRRIGGMIGSYCVVNFCKENFLIMMLW